jgi:hypothetical protein
VRPPEELDLLDWPSLHHAYGGGRDVPAWIRLLYSDDTTAVDGALGELFNRVLHQGSVYPATVEAVPFVAHAAVHATRRRDGMLAFLAGAGGSDPEPYGGTEEDGRTRVSDEVPGLLHLLRDDDRDVRRQAVRVAIRATGPTVPTVLQALTACHASDPDAGIRAEALTVLTRLDPDPRPAERRLRSALTDPVAAVRATAALALLERTPAPYPADLVTVLADAGGDNGFGVPWPEFFPGVGDTDSRVAAVLDADADATAAVARSWIAQGDTDGRGTRRAVQLAMTWRDRETDTVRLLTEAIPHQREPYALGRCLAALARWIGGTTGPAPATADAVLPHAQATDSPAASDAQLVLGRLGDERLLLCTPSPDPAALAALAARTGDLDHRRRALTSHRLGGCAAPHTRAGELLDVLTPESAARLLPELLHLLRTVADAELARRFGGWATADPDLLDLLDRAAGGTDQDLATAAAVAAARLGADPEPALRLLAGRVADHGRALGDAALLGPVAAPLLPLVERRLGAGHAWDRLRAAEAHWRITGDTSRALPVLTALVTALPVGAHALRVLRLTGVPCPPALRPTLAVWASSDRRVLGRYHLGDPWSEGGNRDDRLREDARQMLA